ncbi:hypothetical protein Tco_0145458 [Tanacetum coccineum]
MRSRCSKKGDSGNFAQNYDTEIPQSSGPIEPVADEAVHKERGDRLVRAATTASSLEAEHVSGNITKTQSKATLNETSSQGTSTGSGPRCQETMGGTIAETRLKLNELMELCTNLQQKVLDLEKAKTSDQKEIATLKRRVKKLEERNKSRGHGLKRLYKVGVTRRVESSNEENLGEDASKQGRMNLHPLLNDVVPAFVGWNGVGRGVSEDFGGGEVVDGMRLCEVVRWWGWWRGGDKVDWRLVLSRGGWGGGVREWVRLGYGGVRFCRCGVGVAGGRGGGWGGFAAGGGFGEMSGCECVVG